MITAATLHRASLEELERLFERAPIGPAPTGRMHGRALHRVDTPFARSAATTAMVWPFERLAFGVDFETRTWFFVHRRARIGRFRVERGRSRWRDTEALQLHYDVSRLPFRAILYDEVKPLDEGLCLGLGGIAFDRGRGDLFFFVLEAAK